MITDILNNTISINLKAIEIFGLHTAAYISILIDIYKKASKKNKLDNDYMRVDRKYITSILSLSSEEQLICDANLMKVALIKKHDDNPDIIKLDLTLYLSMLNNDDIKLIDDIRNHIKINKPKGIKLSQRQQVINNLKDSIVCSNYELLTALRDWVESIYAKPQGFLSKTAIQAFQDTLNNYTKGDLDLALRIVRIASIQGYRDCQWAINVYEKDLKIQRANSLSVKTTIQQVASESDLTDIVF